MKMNNVGGKIIDLSSFFIFKLWERMFSLLLIYWDEMMLMTLRWVDVDYAIVMIYVVYVHGGKLDVPGGKNRVVKEF